MFALITAAQAGPAPRSVPAPRHGILLQAQAAVEILQTLGALPDKEIHAFRGQLRALGAEQRTVTVRGGPFLAETVSATPPAPASQSDAYALFARLRTRLQLPPNEVPGILPLGRFLDRSDSVAVVLTEVRAYQVCLLFRLTFRGRGNAGDHGRFVPWVCQPEVPPLGARVMGPNGVVIPKPPSSEDLDPYPATDAPPPLYTLNCEEPLRAKVHAYTKH